eukprot:scaffold10366_cov111-Skeletonema_marinoi.AAC.3
MIRGITTSLLLAISVCSGDEINSTKSLHQYDRSLASKTYCPPEKSGRVPTENCNGYVECVKGVQGNNRFDCAPGTIFDAAADTCNWPDAVLDCSPYIAYADGKATDEDLSSTNNYCPAEYTGRAPTSRCSGYVNCVYGEPTSAAECQSLTSFDSKTQMCVAAMTECKLLVEVTEGMSEEMIQMEGEPGAETEDSLRIVFPRDCSGKFTGKAAINDCAGYIDCVDGAEIARYNCTQGTLFDRNIGLCNWKASVFCESSSPSIKPTPAPSTASPTPWDPNNVYYPKWSEGLCVNDGKHPEDVDVKYLFSDIEVCCQTYFPTNQECVKITLPPTNAPTPTNSKPKIWYPDYVNNICKKDGKYGPYEQNFFSSYDECCKFDFMDEVKCMGKKPAIYYANYDTNTCTSDGNPSPYEDKLFMTHQECCQYDWIHTETCTSAGDVPVLNSAPVTVVEVDYYPDLVYNKCKCDGKQRDTDQIFSSYDECCKYPWLNKNECMKHSHECTAQIGGSVPVQNSAPVTVVEVDYYPDLCKNDGNHPDGVLVFTSHQELVPRSWEMYATARMAGEVVVTLNPSNKCDEAWSFGGGPQGCY